MEQRIEMVTKLIGYVSVLVFLGLAYLSMHPEMELTWPVIAGIIMIIAMALGKVEDIAIVIEKWNTKRVERNVSKKKRQDEEDEDD